MKLFLIFIMCLSINAKAQFFSVASRQYKFPLDIIPNAAVAYSLRRLRTGWSGSAITVRRSSDNATLDIGFNSLGELNTAALLSFIGTGSGYITKWWDQTGNGIHLTQTTNSNQPRIVNAGVIDTENSRPTIKFIGTSPSSTVFNCLNLATPKTTNGHISAIFNLASDGFILGHNSTYYYHSLPTTNLIRNNSYPSNSVKTGAGYVNGVSTTPTTIAWPTTFSIIELQPATPATGTDWDNVGRDRVNHHMVNSSFSELIIWDTALSDKNRMLLEKNQGAFYNITVN